MQCSVCSIQHTEHCTLNTKIMPSAAFVNHVQKEKSGPDDPELLETLQESLEQVDAMDLIIVAGELTARRHRFAELLDAPGEWGEAELTWITRAVTPSRKKAGILREGLAGVDTAVLVPTLLDENRPLAARFGWFVEQLGDIDVRLRVELAGGLLHAASPRDRWLWTRWMWDMRTQTGALALLTGSTVNLQADTVAESYMRVGSVTAVAMGFAEKTGLLTPGLTEDPQRSPFASDVFLACVYGIYLYGITNWRLSREYNRLLPTLPNLMRKLLGLPKVVGK